MFRRAVSPVFTVTAFLSCFLFTGAAVGYENEGVVRAALNVSVSGYFLFITTFLANDPQTLPKTFLGKIYYGALFGGVTAVFRAFGKVEGYPAFSLLLCNTLTERADIIAEQTVAGVNGAVVFVRDRLDSYERIREKEKTGDEADLRPELFDTQEIPVIRQDYNMPPIDNKVIKINRKKQSILLIIREKIENMSEKRKAKKTESEITDINFFENLRDGVKELGSAFKKREDIPEIADGESRDTGTDPVKMSLLIDDEAVEISPPDEPEPETEVEIIDEEFEKSEEAEENAAR